MRKYIHRILMFFTLQWTTKPKTEAIALDMQSVTSYTIKYMYDAEREEATRGEGTVAEWAWRSVKCRIVDLGDHIWHMKTVISIRPEKKDVVLPFATDNKNLEIYSQLLLFLISFCNCSFLEKKDIKAFKTEKYRPKEGGEKRGRKEKDYRPTDPCFGT